ncbi:MAG: ATP-dependent DNA ligase, partial [Actinomycetota bacterium]
MSPSPAPVVVVDDREIEISNPHKVLFPDDGITKLDLARYYERVGVHLVRHSAGRPLALQRFPNGIGEGGFFQKQASDWFPDWIETVEVPTRDGSTGHVVLRSIADLVYLANLGTITPHTLLVDAGDLAEPVEVIVDLDPSTDDLGPVRAAAGRLRELFESIDTEPWVKSSGSRGLHVHVDLAPSGGFGASRALAEDVARVLVAAEPDAFTTAFHKKDRGDRLLLDVMRNAHGQHAVAPYGLRPLPGAPVAAPLDWAEALSSGFDPRRWTMQNLFRRLGRRDDPWV